MIYIAVATAVCFGLRPGEVANVGPYLGDPKFPNATAADHRYLWRDVTFEVGDVEGGLYSYESFHIHLDPKPPVDLIIFTKESSKTSQGEFDGLQHGISRGNDMETLFFDDFIEWASICGSPSGDNMIFSRMDRVSRVASRWTLKNLTSRDYSAAIKAVAAAHDLPVECFSGKSPRVCAITNSTMAGHSSLYTRRITGHASEGAALHYLHSLSGTTAGKPDTPVRDRDPSDPVHERRPGSTATTFADPNMIPLASLKRAVAHGTAFQAAASSRKKS
jgi:hypothetical protein